MLSVVTELEATDADRGAGLANMRAGAFMPADSIRIAFSMSFALSKELEECVSALRGL